MGQNEKVLGTEQYFILYTQHADIILGFQAFM